MSHLEELLALQLDHEGIRYQREVRFAALAVGGPGKGLRYRLKDRGLKDWRFDFVIDDAELLAVEVEGGGWTRGRHSRGVGFAADLVKYQEAMKLGWLVYRVDGALIRNGQALDTIKRLIELRE